jgi:hypothetical protein
MSTFSPEEKDSAQTIQISFKSIKSEDGHLPGFSII